MLRRFASISPFFMLLLAFTIGCVYAEEEPDVNVMDLPGNLAAHLGVSVFVAEVILSSLFLFSVGLTLSVLKAKGLLILIVTFPLMGVLIAIGWLPFWILLLLSLLVAFMYADKIKKML